MDRYNRNNDYRGNAHIPPSVFISSRKAFYRNDNPSLHTQQSLQSNATLSSTNNSPQLHEQYPPVTNDSKEGKTPEQFLISSFICCSCEEVLYY